MMPRLMTMDELKAWTAATILFLVAVLLTGCASLGPTSKDPYQILANDAVRALHGWPVYVTTFPDSNLGQYYCRGARIELGLSGNARWLIAHELGHHLSGHCDEGTPPEMEANTVAIKVLQVWGDTEARRPGGTSSGCRCIAETTPGLPRLLC